jgi:hypothetical protein
MSVHESELKLRELGVPPEQAYLLLRSAGYNMSLAVERWLAGRADVPSPIRVTRSDVGSIHSLPVAQAEPAAPGEQDTQAHQVLPCNDHIANKEGSGELELDGSPGGVPDEKPQLKQESVDDRLGEDHEDIQLTISMSDIPSDRGAYYTQLMLVLCTARQEHARLLLREERAWVDMLLPCLRSPAEETEGPQVSSLSSSSESSLTSVTPVDSTKPRLSLSAQTLYARLFSGRKGGWIRLSSLFNYHEVFGPITFEMESASGTNLASEEEEFSATARYEFLQQAIEELVAAKLVESARPLEGHFDECARATVEDSPLNILILSEAKALAARYKIKQPKTVRKSSSSSGGHCNDSGGGHRDNLLEAIVSHLTTTRTISFFGGPSKGSVPYMTHIQSIMANTLVERSHAPSFLAPRPGGAAWKRARAANLERDGDDGDNADEGVVKEGISSLECLHGIAPGLEASTVKSGHLAIRLAGKPRALIRRLLRVVNLTARSSVASGSSGSDIDDSTEVIDEGSTTLMSSGLMQSFGLLKFAPYDLGQRSFYVFRDRRALLLWEAAVELRHEMHQYLYEWDSGKLWEGEKCYANLSGTGEINLEEDSNVEVNSNSEYQKHDAKRQRQNETKDAIEQNHNVEIIVVEDDDEGDGIGDAVDIPAAACELRRLLIDEGTTSIGSTSETSPSWDAATREDIDVLRLAFIARAACDIYLSRGDANSELLPLAFAKDSHTRLPTWLENMSPFAVLVSIVWRGVKPLEQLGRYGEAIDLLKWLLRITVVDDEANDEFFLCVAPHRRGQWHIRLAIDLQHAYKVNKKKLAASSAFSSKDSLDLNEALLNARMDPWVRGGDRLEILKRAAKHTPIASCAVSSGVTTDSKFPAKPSTSKEGWDEALIKEWLNESGSSFVEASNNSGESFYASVIPEVDVVQSRRLNHEVGKKSRFVGLSEFEDSVGVEQLAIQHYSKLSNDTEGCNNVDNEAIGGGWSGMHSEGSQIRELFALLMWSIIFAPVPDVFQTPFQSAPLDLNCASYPKARSTDAPAAFEIRDSSKDSAPMPSTIPCACYGFYAARAEAIEARLAELRNLTPCELAQEVLDSWAINHGSTVRGLDWRPGRHTPLGLLQAVAACLGGNVLAAMFRTLALDHRHFNAGLPDLLLIRALKPVADSWEVAESHTWLTPSIEARLDPFAVRVRRRRRTDEDLMGDPSEKVSTDSAIVEDEDQPISLPLGYRFQARLVEVKGPSDTLSYLQRAWQVIIGAAGGHCRICRIVDSKKEEDNQGDFA